MAGKGRGADAGVAARVGAADADERVEPLVDREHRLVVPVAAVVRAPDLAAVVFGVDEQPVPHRAIVGVVEAAGEEARGGRRAREVDVAGGVDALELIEPAAAPVARPHGDVTVDVELGEERVGRPRTCWSARRYPGDVAGRTGDAGEVDEVVGPGHLGEDKRDSEIIAGQSI